MVVVDASEIGSQEQRDHLLTSPDDIDAGFVPHPNESAEEVAVAGVAPVEVAGAVGRYELAPLDAVRVFTGRVEPSTLDATRTDPAWGPVLA